MSEQRKMHNFNLDAFNWPVGVVSLASLPWLQEAWEHMPAPTSVYATISAAFMIFQMLNALGLLDKFKRRKVDTDKG